MSRCLNKATLIGNLGADPEIRTIPTGARVATFSLATSQRWNDRDGKPCERTQWHRIVVWDSLPATFAFVEKYLHKGDRVYVEGEIEYRSFEDKGATRWTTEIKAGDVLSAGTASTAGDDAGGTFRRTTRNRRGANTTRDAHQLVAL
jgi:single-strand DNA-binding protein